MKSRRCLLPGRVILLVSSLVLAIDADAARAQTLLFADDWTAHAAGQQPSSVSVLHGAAVVADYEGRRWLRMEDRTDFEVVFPRALPDHFVVEFEMMVPSTHAYPVEVRAALRGEPADYRRTTLRTERATAHCGAIASGVYGGLSTSNRIKSHYSMAGSLVECRVEVDGRRIQVAYADRTPVTMDDVDFGRTERLRFTVPARVTEVAFIGPIRVSSRSPDAAAVAITPRGAPAPAVEPQPPSAQPETPPTQRVIPRPDLTPERRPGEPQPTPQTTAPISAPAQAPQIPTTAAPPGGANPPLAGGAVARVQQLHASGTGVAQAVATLMQEFGLTEAAAVKALLDGSYTLDAVAVWLRSGGRNLSSAVALLETWVNAGQAERSQRVIALVRTLNSRFSPAPLDLLNTTHARFPLVDVLMGLGEAGVRMDAFAQHLFKGNHVPESSAEALRQAFNASATDVARAMQQANLGVSRQIQILVDVFALSLDQALGALRANNLTPQQIVAELRKVSQITPEQTVAVFYQAGYELGATIKAVSDVFNRHGPHEWHSLFQQVNAPMIAIMNGIIDGLDLPPDSWIMVFSRQGPVSLQDMLVMMQSRGITSQEAAKRARDAGFTAGQVIGPLAMVFATVPAIAMKAVAELLIDAGYTPSSSASAMKAHFNATAQDIAARLAENNVNVNLIRDALVSSFNMTVDAAVALLAGMGIS